ncbi:hypothetical protein HanRHA438_Chr09g0384061 [Helianthus annuus]|nr:hypothetical protein HanRHA438_Chr09g0384061 [Helianthus annuus]
MSRSAGRRVDLRSIGSLRKFTGVSFLAEISAFLRIYNYFKSKLPFWSMRFGQFYHFSSNLKLFASGSLWFQFYCHFGPNLKSGQISKKKKLVFVLFLRGILVIILLL